jgi:hypothetical protein
MIEDEDIPYLVWDTYQIAKDRAAYLIEEGEFTDEDKAFEDACADSDHHTFEWEYLTEWLTELMQEINPDEIEWFVTGEGLGWQRRSGHKTVQATTGEKLLQEILPNTECTFSIYKEEGQLRLVNSHHDAMGEVYIIRPQEGDEG